MAKHWNFRIVRDASGDLAIHEVFYAEDGKIKSWTQDGLYAVDAEHGMVAFMESIEFAYAGHRRAVALPILNAGTLPGGETPNEQLTRILETAGEIHAEAAKDIRDSAWMPQELAAQLAERVACQPTEGSADFLDGWVAACETVASDVRKYRQIKAAG